MAYARQVPLYAVLVLFASGISLTADTPVKVRWRTGADVSGSQDARALRASLLRLAARDEARHVALRLAVTADRTGRRELAAAGLELLSYLGDHAYFAALVTGKLNTASLMRSGMLRGVHSIRTEWKLHPQLAAGAVPDWAVVPRGHGRAHVAVCVLFHGDVPIDTEGVAIVRGYGGTVRSLLRTVNGLVVELPRGNVQPLAADDAVQWVEPPLPAFTEVNDSNRAITEAEEVQGAPYGLSGAGVTVLVYDGGLAAEMHPDFGGRLTPREVDALSNHATHVSGTIGGGGNASGGLYRGMAPGVRMESYGFHRSDPDLVFLYQDPGDIELNYGHAIHVFGADLSNNSIGTNTCRNGFDCNITGDYGVTAQVIDSIVSGALGAPFRVVWANGNERSCGRCLNQGVHTPEGYHSTAPPACAKNQISVGALNSNDDSVTSFTSWGPCDDGRLKPDISAPGCQSDADNGVTSCCFVSAARPPCSEVGPDDACCDDVDGDGFGYDALCGTSMATPTVTGLAALLLEDYRAQFPGRADPRNSTLKALFAHNAEDVGNAGPDYQTGYGSVRIRRAIDFLRGGSFLEERVEHAADAAFLVRVEAGDGPLRITLAWDDVPATPNVTAALVNDLDLVVRDPEGVRHHPWTLDPEDPTVAAVRNRADDINNIEQVFVEIPLSGLWRVSVVGTDVPVGPQVFSLCASPRLLRDCNANGVPDEDELAAGEATDCTANGVLDQCEPDCNKNGTADSCDIADGLATDCNSDGVPDGTQCDPLIDCNANGENDACDVAGARSKDCNRNGVPDECEDCNTSSLADECDIALGLSSDCNLNASPDECDLASETSPDCNANATPDECEVDCNENTIPDDCDITNGTSRDCNDTDVPDECELGEELSVDCNANGSPDECDIVAGASADCDADGVPDDCQFDCNANGVSDVCDIVYGVSADSDGNWVPDECLRVLRVPVEYDTIQDAIDAAADGDTVLVADGTYTGASNKNLDFGGKVLTVRCEKSSDGCVIDCQNNGRAFVFHSGEGRGAVVDGFSITRGAASVGGGIACIESSPTVRNCVITQNTAFDFGGGINCERSSPLISQCVITNNSGTFFGGGVTCALGSAVIENCVIAGNSSTAGVVFGDGGGVYLFEAPVILDTCLIAGNTVAGFGGGMYAWESDAVIRNCCVVGNVASGAGGGTSFWGFSRPLISSSILWDNFAPQGRTLHVVGSAVNVAYSDVEGGTADAHVLFGEVIWGAGAIVAPPSFVDPVGADGLPETFEDNDYHLLPGAPGIDAGDPVIAADGSGVDADGEPRVLGGRVDMGVDESPADCDGNGVADHVEIADGALADCNGNLVPDDCDLASGASEDSDSSGVLDECECAFDVTPPQIDHARMCAGGADEAFPFGLVVMGSGYIDPRRSSFDGQTPQLGLRAITLVFTEPVFDVGSTVGGSIPGVLTAASFGLAETGEAESNVVAAIVRDQNDATRARVEFERIITRQEWTTIVASVEDACGNVIASAGNQGPGALEPDRVDIGFLPGDVDQNGVVQPLDLSSLRRLATGAVTPECLSARMFGDIDRDGSVSGQDIIRFRQAIVPLWTGRAMNHPQP